MSYWKLWKGMWSGILRTGAMMEGNQVHSEEALGVQDSEQHRI